MTVTSDIASVFRNFNTTNDPETGPHNPTKSEVRALLQSIYDAIPDDANLDDINAAIAAAPGATWKLSSVTGADTITASTADGNWANTAGRIVLFTAADTNTTTGPTLSIDSATALPIVTRQRALPPVGSIVDGRHYLLAIAEGGQQFIAYELSAPDADAIAGTRGDLVITPASLDAVLTDRSVTGAGLATGGGTLHASRTITVPAATNSQAIAGAATDKAMTPAADKAALDARVGPVETSLAAKAAKAQTITAGGLATGGGDLSADRTISVPASDVATALGGSATDSAITPATAAVLRGLTHTLTVGGTANAITATTALGNWTNKAGRLASFIAAATNTDTAVTLAIDGAAGLRLRTPGANDPPVGSIIAGRHYLLVLTEGGSTFCVLNLTAPSSAASNSSDDLLVTSAGLQTVLDARSPAGTRPGDQPAMFGATASGASEDIGAAPGTVRDSIVGKVLAIDGTEQIVQRYPTRIEAGRAYMARWAMLRMVDTPDPAGDAVRCRVAWLDSAKALISTTTVATINDLSVSSGEVVRTAVLGQSGATGATITAPSGTVYARLTWDTFGSLPRTGLSTLSLVDITDVASAGLGDDAVQSALDAAAEALTSAGTATTKATAAQASADRVAMYDTIAEAISAAADLAVGQSFRTNGNTAIGDGGETFRKVVDSDPGPGGVELIAGTKWGELIAAEPHVWMFGAKGDGTTDDTAALQAAIDYAKFKGCRVFVPAGTYKVTDELDFYLAAPAAGWGLRGEGWDSTIFECHFSGFDKSVVNGDWNGTTRSQGPILSDIRVTFDATDSIQNPVGFSFVSAGNLKIYRYSVKASNNTQVRITNTTNSDADDVMAFNGGHFFLYRATSGVTFSVTATGTSLTSDVDHFDTDNDAGKVFYLEDDTHSEIFVIDSVSDAKTAVITKAATYTFSGAAGTWGTARAAFTSSSTSVVIEPGAVGIAASEDVVGLTIYATGAGADGAIYRGKVTAWVDDHTLTVDTAAGTTVAAADIAVPAIAFDGDATSSGATNDFTHPNVHVEDFKGVGLLLRNQTRLQLPMFKTHADPSPSDTQISTACIWLDGSDSDFAGTLDGNPVGQFGKIYASTISGIARFGALNTPLAANETLVSERNNGGTDRGVIKFSDINIVNSATAAAIQGMFSNEDAASPKIQITGNVLSLQGAIEAFPVNVIGGLYRGWYEDLTFTPTVEGSTITGAVTLSVHEGSGYRIGDHVFIRLRVKLSAIGTAPSGNVRINTNLPFNAATQSGGWPMTVDEWKFNLVTAGAQVTANMATGNTVINLFENADNAAPVNFTGSGSQLGTDSQITIQGWFKASRT